MTPSQNNPLSQTILTVSEYFQGFNKVTDSLFPFPASPYLDHDTALVVAKAHVVGSLESTDAPHAVQPIVEGVLQAVRISMPHPHCAVLRAGQDDW